MAEKTSNVNMYGFWWDNNIAQNILKKKYFHDEELKVAEKDFKEAFFMFVKRVASIFPDKKIAEFVGNSIINGDFLPAGRILYAAGSKGKFKATTGNCYIERTGDQLEEIFETAKRMARVFSTGGGEGLDISPLRPRGAKVHNTAKTSTGAVSFMNVFNMVAETIAQGSRRGALLLALDCSHPDIEEFLEIKQNNTAIQGANISIKFTDKFMEAVKNNETFPLYFKVKDTGEEIKKEINARDFFMKFAEAQYNYAEPGAIFIDEVQSRNLLSGYPEDEYKINVSNPCVTGDTLILTKTGWYTIKELAESNEPVTVWNGYEWSEVKPKLTARKQKLWRVVWKNQEGHTAEIYCTDYHKWVVLDRDGKPHRVTTKELTPDMVTARYTMPWDSDKQAQYTLISVTETGYAEDVYCMNEPKNHTFIANGVLTGNCSEFFSNSWSQCCLGSINLYNFVKNPFTKEAYFDFHTFIAAVQKATTALDMVLDYGLDMQPLPQTKECTINWRQIGLGVFGLADMLVALRLEYGSTDALRLLREIMYQMQHSAYIASALRGKKCGSFGKFDPVKFYNSNMVDEIRAGMTAQLDADTRGAMRNGTLLAIAPTGSISMLFSESGGVEPYYNIAYERTTHVLEKQGKSFHISMLAVDHLLRFNGIDPSTISNEEIKKRFPYVVDTYDIEPKRRIDMQAAMQEYVDNAISSTINLREETSVQDIFDLYVYAWEQGCKGITIFRDNCKRINIMGTDHGVKRADVDNVQEVQGMPDNVEVAKVYSKAEKLNSLEPYKRNGLKSLWGRTFLFHTACIPKFYVTVNVKDGDIFEVFVGVDRGCQANISTITRLTSYALRLGGKVDDIVDELNSAVCPACTAVRQKGDLTVNKSCASCIADAIKEMQKTLDGGKNDEALVKQFDVEPPKVKAQAKDHNAYMRCPECGEMTLLQDGKCNFCSACGYSKCD